MDEEYRGFYDQKVDTYPERDQPSIVRYQKAVELADMGAGSSCLDIACKDAALWEIIQEQGLDVRYTGIDIAEQVVAANRTRYPGAQFETADITEGLEWPDGSFDFVFALEILEHVPEPTKLLTEARRLLKPGGRFLVSVPNPYYYTEIINELRGHPDTEGHIFAFRDANIRALLGLCGLQVEQRMGTYLQIPKRVRGAFRNHAFWLVRRVPPILARSRIYCCTAGEHLMPTV